MDKINKLEFYRVESPSGPSSFLVNSAMLLG